MGWLVNAVGLLVKGGWVMVPLMVCSIVAVAFFVERFAAVRRSRVDVGDLVTRAEKAVYSGQNSQALSILQNADTPVTRVLAAGLRSRHLGEQGAERAMEEQGTREMSMLGSRLSWLDTIVTIAPLLGLLGTVTGMISAFHVIATREGISTPTAITGGVAEALIATATGLLVAILTLVGHNYLQEQIKAIVADIEVRATAMLNVFAEAGEERREITSLSA